LDQHAQLVNTSKSKPFANKTLFDFPVAVLAEMTLKVNCFYIFDCAADFRIWFIPKTSLPYQKIACIITETYAQTC